MKNYLALKASAGSGKTFALTVRYISLLLLGAKPKEILTLTFTNKAANEMSERIHNTLLDLGNDEIYINEILKVTNLSKESILKRKEFLVNQFIDSHLSIYTIDKFVNKILREFCGYLGLSDDFEIKNDDLEKLSSKFLDSLDEKSFDKLLEFSIHENKKYNSIFDIFTNLYEKYEDIKLKNIDGNLINIQKEQVLSSAFKIKELIKTSNQASDAAKSSVDFETFETLLHKGKTWLTKDCLADFRSFKKCSTDILENHFTELKEQLTIYYKLREGFSLSRLNELYSLFKDFKLNYSKIKNYLTFNDISNLTYELLSSKIDKEFLYFRLDTQYSHILIDEFQDTSLLQYKILEPLIKEIVSSKNERFQTFFYVGDTKQSIYRFRGGKRELFDYLSNSYEQIIVEILNTNYRSRENIINFVNKAFGKLTAYEYHDQLTIKKGGYVEVFEDDTLLNSEERFKNLAKKIAFLLKNGVDSNDISILTYTNDDVLEIYSYLKVMFPSMKITTEMTSKLINQENVKAVINAIKYLYFEEEIYKENLNALLGKAPTNELNILIDIKKLSLSEVVLKISKQLNILDDNVIKLIENLNGFKNIVDFIYEVDKLDISMPNQEQHGLQILTVFKSKGLEFHTVILMDRIKQKMANRDSLLFDYEEIELKNIYYKISNLDNYDIGYKQALEKEKKLTLDDELNILYVGLTRAKNNMIIFKKQEKSVFDLLEFKSYTNGELVKSEKSTKVYEKVQKVIYKPLDLGKQDKPIQDEKEENSYSLHSKYYGIATHYCLEMMPKFDEESLAKSLKFVENRYLNYLDYEDLSSIKSSILNLIKNEKFQSIVSGAILKKEQAMVFDGELKIIDLLVQKENKLYIFDYKTTKEQLVEHEKQVSYYNKAIKDIYKTDDVSSCIIYLKNDDVQLKFI
jgi:exodeoxyribonuclease V beta subunit